MQSSLLSFECRLFSFQMFGSLLSLADAPPTSKIKLTENWYKIIRRWYPDLHQKVYCVPPVHFKAVSYRPAPEPYKQYKMHKYQPAQYSTTKDDEAQQRVLWTMSTFLRRKGVAAFVLSNMEFQNYLNKGYEWEDSSIQDFPKPDIRNKNEEGEIDVLVIDKIHGVFVLEVKAVGDPDTHRPLSKEAKLTVNLFSGAMQYFGHTPTSSAAIGILSCFTECKTDLFCFRFYQKILNLM